MFRKMLLSFAAFSSAACASPTSQIDQPILGVTEPLAKLHMVAVRDIHCGMMLGTANYIDNRGILLTAYHVVLDNKTCRDVITGQVMKVYYVDKENDIALLAADTKGDPRTIPIDCRGFVTGKKYVSIGYAHGYDLRLDVLTATNETSTDKLIINGSEGKKIPAPGFRHLKGSMISGMSGGAVIDLETWKIVGINNISDTWTNAYSKDLKNTILCKR